MTQVQPRFKDDQVDCPCGCPAFGRLNRATGHTFNCHDACPTCANPKRRVRMRFEKRRVPTAVRRQVAARAHGLCEARVSEDCMNGGVHAHHRRRRSQGGLDTAENLLWVCTPCHLWVHEHVAEAVERGFLIATEVADAHE